MIYKMSHLVTDETLYWRDCIHIKGYIRIFMFCENHVSATRSCSVVDRDLAMDRSAMQGIMPAVWHLCM
jgi:hypothetical protein